MRRTSRRSLTERGALMEYKDYYAILGVPRDADAATIKRAYRKLARAHHPDLAPGDPLAEGRFKDINEANAVLSDPVRRQRYDAVGPGQWSERTQAPPSRSSRRPQTSASGFEDFSDFFRAFFGEDILGGDAFTTPFGATRRGSMALEASAEITLEEAYTGASRRTEIEGRRIEIRIPAGVDTGSRVRIADAAGPGRDLMVSIDVRPHPIFERHGADLLRDLPVTLGEALLGAKVPVKTLKGRVMLTLPPGTQHGRVFRLAGQGMPRKDDFGDLRVRIRVVLPSHLQGEALKAARRLVELVDQPEPAR